jgi:hypothetical protein
VDAREDQQDITGQMRECPIALPIFAPAKDFACFASQRFLICFY